MASKIIIFRYCAPPYKLFPLHKITTTNFHKYYLKMKKAIHILLFALLLVSCSSDDNNEVLSQLTIKITSDETIKDYSKFQITITESRTGTESTGKSDASGTCIFDLPMGSYQVTVEDLIDGASTMYGRVNNYTLSGSQATLSIKVEPIMNTLDKTFVLDELYFNGASNGSWNYTYYEQYFTIRNISDRALYADGLSFGVAGDYNALEAGDDMSKYLPDNVIISQFYTIPGDGRTYKIEPNKSLVIAFSAINHNESGSKPKSLDLSGADLEIYVEGGMTADNPDVPNVIVNYSVFQAFHWQYSGAAPMILFRLEGDAATFLESNKVNLPNPASMGTMYQDFVKLPTKYIIDAVETGCADEFYEKVLPVTVDRSSILINDAFYGGFNEQFVQRKSIVDDKGNNTVQDTNDSAKDFVLNVGGQKSYPKK